MPPLARPTKPYCMGKPSDCAFHRAAQIENRRVRHGRGGHKHPGGRTGRFSMLPDRCFGSAQPRRVQASSLSTAWQSPMPCPSPRTIL